MQVRQQETPIWSETHVLTFRSGHFLSPRCLCITDVLKRVSIFMLYIYKTATLQQRWALDGTFDQTNNERAVLF